MPLSVSIILDLLRHGFEHVLEDVPSRAPDGLFDELGHGRLARTVDADKQIQLSLRSLHLGDVDVEEPNRVALELLRPGASPPEIGQAADPGPLQASMQRLTCQMRDRRLQGVKAAAQQKQCMTTKCDDCRFFGFSQNRRARFFMA